MFQQGNAYGVTQSSWLDQAKFFFFQLLYQLPQFGFRNVSLVRVQRHVKHLGIVSNPIPSAKHAAAFWFENEAQHIIEVKVEAFFADHSSESIAIHELFETAIVRRQSCAARSCLTSVKMKRLP